MANWKSILGLGAACAACCAVPLAGALGVMGVMGAGGVLAAAGAALLACADELALAFGILGALALAFMYWRRRKVTNAALSACTYPAATPCAPGTPCQGCQTRQTT